jgi:hypothetical protein
MKEDKEFTIGKRLDICWYPNTPEWYIENGSIVFAIQLGPLYIAWLKATNFTDW